MPVQELDVAVEVFVEVTPAGQRPRDSTQGIRRQRGDEEDRRTEAPIGEALEPRECNGEPVSYAGQA